MLVGSDLMRQALKIFAQFVWLGLCVAALAISLHFYQGTSDWKMEEGLAWDMIVLGFPTSLLVAFGLALIGAVLAGFGASLPGPSRAEMVATWAPFVLAGYAQWFLLTPCIVRRCRNAITRKAHQQSN